MKTWQTNPNANHYTRERLACSECGKYQKRVLDIRVEEAPEYNKVYCWECAWVILNEVFGFIESDYVFARLIEDVLFDKRTQTRRKTRQGMTLKLRFEVMKRDHFKCVLCGATSEKSTLEIDHIIPVANGGTNDPKNLRTCCFECNHGKGSTL